jgi:hypothetical protein
MIAGCFLACRGSFARRPLNSCCTGRTGRGNDNGDEILVALNALIAARALYIFRSREVSARENRSDGLGSSVMNRICFCVSASSSLCNFSLRSLSDSATELINAASPFLASSLLAGRRGWSPSSTSSLNCEICSRRASFGSGPGTSAHEAAEWFSVVRFSI